MDKLGFFVKLAIILLVFSLVCIFIVTPFTVEFILSIISAVICLIVIIVGTIIIRKRSDK